MKSIAVELRRPPILLKRRRVASPIRSRSLALIFVAIVPAALIVRLISEFGVNVPFGDEWSMVPLFAKWNDHQLRFADLFHQHNEHRILFPKLLYIAFAQLTHWNLRAEMFFSVFLCALTSICIYGLLAKTVGGSTHRRLIMWATINLLIFSPAQAENWFWGFQLAMFIPTTCLVAILLILQSSSLNAIRFCGASILAVVATFSFGNGLLLWPVIILYLILRGSTKGWTIGWSGTFAFVTTIYFVGYEWHPAAHQHPVTAVDYLVYFLRFNGNALGQLPMAAHLLWTAVIGATAVLLYGSAFGFLFHSRRPAVAIAAPWIALAAYALGSALLAASSRIHEGTFQALDSRYSSISVNLYIALIPLLVITSDLAPEFDVRSRFSRMTPFLTSSFMATICGWYVLTFPEVFIRINNLSQLKCHGLAFLNFCKVIAPSGTLRHELRVHADFPEFVRNIDVMERLNLLKPPLRRSNLLHDGASQPDRSTEEFGRFDLAVKRSSTTFEIGGWAFLPQLNQPAACVVLAYESDGKWFGFALAEVNEKRPDKTQKLGFQYKLSGWRSAIDLSALPNGAHQISAWAVDALTGDVFRLPGGILLPTQVTERRPLSFLSNP